MRLLFAAMPLLTAIVLPAQIPSDKPAGLAHTAVQYLYPEQLTLPANRPTAVDLHFHIEDGLHINSHTPRASNLIPTTLAISDATAVRLAGATYPEGHDYTFPADPSEKLSVYTGEFTIHAELVAQPGNHFLEATLRYQACDQQACMPPRTIKVPIDVIGQ